MQKNQDDAAEQLALQKWVDAGAPLPSDTRMNAENLGAFLEPLEPSIPSMRCTVTPSSFNPNEKNLRAYPRSFGWDWPSCAGLLRHFGGSGVMSRLPLFWQIEPSLHRACQASDSFIFLNDKANMPLGAEAIRRAEIVTVLTNADDAAAFSDFLLQNKYPLPKAWLIVHPATGLPQGLPAHLTDSPSNIGQEIHVLPSIPLLEQCPALSDTKQALFHRSPGYYWEEKETHNRITGPSEDLCPLIRYEIPFFLKGEGQCACGEEIVRAIASVR